VIRALAEGDPDLRVEGIGGPNMAGAGTAILESIERLSTIGLSEAVRTVPRHVALLRRVRRLFAERRYDLAILIDYPGFHMRVAAAARRAGIPVLYYIAPQLWAWGGWRVRSVRRNVQSLAVVLPFEEQFFRSRGVPAEFVGHPLLDSAPLPNGESARRVLGISQDATVLGLLPGSRHQEVERLWPRFRDAATRLRNVVGNLEILVAGVPGGEYPQGDDAGIRNANTREVLAVADAVICKSGTATLEAALAGTPMVIGYTMSPFTYQVARHMVRVRQIGLVNLLAGRRVAPELIQHDVTAEKLANAAGRLLDGSSVAAREQRAAFVEIRQRLGAPGAGARVADIARRLAA
jgi:lipid-A-disaccharide synthase